MTAYTLFGQADPGTTLTADTSPYTMGVQFSVSQDGCTLTGIWFYSASGATTLPVTIALYAVSGASLVHSEGTSVSPIGWSGAAGSGWVRAAFASPPPLTAGTNYKGCIFHTDPSNFYSHSANWWSSGPGSGGVSNGPLSAPDNSGADGGQDTFDSSGALAYPGSSFNAANYWVDVEITTSGSTPVSGSDTGSGAEAAAISAGSADAGSGADASSITAALAGADTGSGAEGAPAIGTASAETGTGTDTGTLAAALPGADTAAGTDSGALSITSTETGLGADASGLTAAVPGADAGAGADAGTVLVPAGSGDTGSGADAATAVIPSALPHASQLGGSAANANTYGGSVQ